MPTADDFNACKGPLRHSWEQFAPINMRRPTFGKRLSVICTRCTTERHDLISTFDGALLQREYRYPDGYRLTPGEQRPTANDRRLWFVTRRRRRSA